MLNCSSRKPLSAREPGFSNMATRVGRQISMCVAGVICATAHCALRPARSDPEAPKKLDANCTLESGGFRTVARIIDAETLALDDGREVRLIGALAPRASDAGAAPSAWPLETEAIRTLTKLVLGRTVKLAFGKRRADRYGRHLAHVFIGQGATEKWVQGELLASGAARAYGLPGSFDCMSELLAHERIARDQRRGLWSTALYGRKPARFTGLLMSRRSRFEIVEGPVAIVSPTKSATYLNFGSDWKTDFTIRIGKDVLSAHPELTQTLSAMTGKRVAVRGWIERRNGPMIDLTDPSQLEVIDADAGSPEVSQRKLPAPAESASTPPDALGKPPIDEDDDTPNTQERPAGPSMDQPGAVNL